MEKNQFTLGSKVVPHSKMGVLGAHQSDSTVWRRAKEKGQDFLYYVKNEYSPLGSHDRWLVLSEEAYDSSIKRPQSGDYYLVSDLDEYRGPNSNRGKILLEDVYEYLHNEMIDQFKVGDTVVVSHKVKSFHLGWENTWVDDMDKFIGRQCIITDITTIGLGIGLRLNDKKDSNWTMYKYSFPIHVIRPAVMAAEEAPKPVTKAKSSDKKLYSDTITVQPGITLKLQISCNKEI